MRRGRGREDARRGSGVDAALPRRGAAAILAAAGVGRRAPSGTPKQFRPLAGRPLLEWSLDVLSAAGCRPVVIMVPLGARADAFRLLAGRQHVVIAEGGATRQASVARALAFEDEVLAAEHVVVHDAARPFIATADVARVLDALDDADGALPALPVQDTLKRVEGDRVVATVARGGLWRAQTPQAFRLGVLRDAHRRAEADAYQGTDDAELVERVGGVVAVVPGDARNLKITYPEDFAVAEAIAGARA